MGSLIPVEFGSDFNNSDIPFDVKRCFFISMPENTEGIMRGKHAHKENLQVIICLNGTFKLSLDDGKGNKEDILLDNPAEAIQIERMVWGELSHFSPNCKIVVLTNDHYSEDDYIRDYNEFLEAVK